MLDYVQDKPGLIIVYLKIGIFLGEVGAMVNNAFAMAIFEISREVIILEFLYFRVYGRLIQCPYNQLIPSFLF